MFYVPMCCKKNNLFVEIVIENIDAKKHRFNKQKKIYQSLTKSIKFIDKRDKNKIKHNRVSKNKGCKKYKYNSSLKKITKT